MYSIVNDKLVGDNVSYASTSKKSSGTLNPKFLVIHYTASDNFDGDVRTLSTSSAKASCQLVVAPDGRVTQIGTFKDKLWHAGVSSWKGYSGLNSYSIGIEVTCPGPLDGNGKTWYGKQLTEGKPFDFVWAKHKNGGPEKQWAKFTDAQIKTLLEIGPLIMQHYGIKEAVGHDQIAPTRKIDPGPCCPDSVFAYLNGNADDEPEIERPDLPGTKEYFKVKGVAPDILVFRASPNGTRKGALPEGVIVEKVSVEGKWMQVRTPAGYVGWVWSDYLKKE